MHFLTPKIFCTPKFIYRYKGHTSDTVCMPGGVGAGTPLGLFCFLVYFNIAGPKSSETTIGQHISSTLNKRKPIDTHKVKWVDDMSCLVSLHLPSVLVPDTRPDIPRPVPYRGRTGHRLHATGI